MQTHLKYLSYLLLLSLSLAACDGKRHKSSESSKTTTAASETVVVKEVKPAQEDGTVGMFLPDFTQLVAREGGTVVNIQAGKTPEELTQNNQDGLSKDDPLYDFFKRLIPNDPAIPEQNDDADNNFGSGFIISSDGYILTNSHVIKGLNVIKVTLTDKREYAAKLIGRDEKSDIALLKIDAQDLPAAKIGNPSDLKVGEWVAAIGAPFGFDNSITAGIVSAKGRSLPNENYTPFIQTDVAINPGNSGGPLFNLKGEVIGINSQIYSRNGGFMGISFAIPIDVAMNVAQQLKTTGKVQRGQLGVVIQEINYDLAKSFGLDKPSGALVAKVLPDSPAQRGGLEVGDIIRSVNGNTIRFSGDLPMVIGALPPEKDVILGIWRRGQEVNLIVKLGSSNDNNQPSTSNAENKVPNIHHQNNGFDVPNVGLQLSAEEGGLFVMRSTGVAAAAGLRRGDVIVEVGGIAVRDQASFNEALAKSGKNVSILTQRSGNAIFFALNLP